MVTDILIDFFDSPKKTYTAPAASKKEVKKTGTKTGKFFDSPIIKSEDVSQYLVNTNLMECNAARAFHITEDEVLDLLNEDNTIRCCEVCNWWFDKNKLANRNDAYIICKPCSKRHKKKKKKR